MAPSTVLAVSVFLIEVRLKVFAQGERACVVGRLKIGYISDVWSVPKFRKSTFADFPVCLIETRNNACGQIKKLLEMWTLKSLSTTVKNELFRRHWFEPFLARSHGGHSEAVPPNFWCAQKIGFKHIMKGNIVIPLKCILPHQTLKPGYDSALTWMYDFATSNNYHQSSPLQFA